MDVLSPRIEQLRLRDLLMLEHIAASASLRVVAQQLHVTQPAVTQALRSLERAFGVALVQRGERGQRGGGLTPAGEAALHRMRVARQELLAAQRAALTPDVALLRLGVLPLTMYGLVPKALMRLRAARPDIHVTLHEDTLARLWQRLDDGQLDAVVGRVPMRDELSQLPTGVDLQRVGSDRLVFVAGVRHLLANLKRLPLTQLVDKAWVLPQPSAFTRQVFDHLFVGAGLTPPAPVITSMSFHSNLNLIADCADLLTIAPASAAHKHAASLGLKTLPTPKQLQASDVVLAYRRSARASPHMGALIAAFAE